MSLIGDPPDRVPHADDKLTRILFPPLGILVLLAVLVFCVVPWLLGWLP